MWNTSGRQSWIKSFKIPCQLQFAKLSFSHLIWNNNRTSRNRFHRLLIATQYIAVEKCILLHNQNDNFFSMPFEVTFATEDKGIYKLLCQTSLSQGYIRKQNSFFLCLQFLFSLYSFISMSLLRNPNVCNGRIVLQFNYFNIVLGFALEN